MSPSADATPASDGPALGRGRRRHFDAERHSRASDTVLDRLVAVASTDPRPWARDWALRERAGITNRRGRRWLWGRAPDRAEGLLWVEHFRGVGSAVGVFLTDPRGAAPRVAEVVGYLDDPKRGGPVVRISEWVPGISVRAVRRGLTTFRFRWVYRVDYRFPTARRLPAAPALGGVSVRRIRSDDFSGLAQLHARAYESDPVETALFREHPGPRADARESMRAILGHDLGGFRRDASFLVQHRGRTVAATCVNDFHGPLISQVMVDPRYRRQGFARHLLLRSLSAIRRWTADPPRLVVTESNRRAVALYRSLGFEIDRRTRGAIGVRERFIGRGSD